MKKILALALAIVMLVGCVMAFSSCGTKLVGFDIELAQAVSKKLGVDVEFKLINWNTKEAELSSKTIDVIWNGMTITPERVEEMEVSMPYMNNKQVAVIRKADSDKYKDTAAMAEAIIGAEDGSAGMGCVVNEDESLAFGKTFNPLDSQMDVLVALNAKTIDVGIMDSVMASYYMSQDTTYASSLMIVENLTLATEQYGIAARKGSGLTKKINQALIDLAKDGTVDAIAEKYGLKSEICIDVNATVAELTEAEKADWNYIVEQGKFIVGYTLFAPIAYEEN